MSDISELERRITAALERIGKGLDRMAAEPAAAAEATATVAGPAGVDEGLQAALDEERTANAQLSARLRAVKEREAQAVARLEAQVARMTRQLDVQGLDLQRMRKTTVQLREQLRVLREAQTGGQADPQMINKAMLAELEALRATRLSETAELDEILAELAPLIEMPPTGAAPQTKEVPDDARA
ncbi:hypothetical protein RNZ50_12665 [Paracoccaceae bacterium Fryx2]|nr:hypothetical protein [Paracoccaceae bacterium Fryx2]